MLGFFGFSLHAANIPPCKNKNFEKYCFFIKKKQKNPKICVSFFFTNLHRVLYMSLPFRQKRQIQNWIKFTFAKSQLKFWDFSITSHCPNAKAPKFQLRFCEGKFCPILDLTFFLKGRETYREPYVNWKTKI